MPLPTRALALWTTNPGRVELREEALGAVHPGHVLVQTLFSGVSRGTEGLVFEGRVPESERQRMRAPFQSGEFPGAVKYGYANVGRVLSGDGLARGTLVFSLFPHQTHFTLPAASVHPIPEVVPAMRAVLAANMETALNALWDAQPLPGDRVSIVGAGVLGCLLLALLTRYPAIDVEVVELSTARAPLVAALGGRPVSAESASTGRDLVFHTSASAGGLRTALGLSRFQGKVVELSWYGSREVNVSLGAAFHSQRLTLLSSQVGSVSPNKPGWTFEARLQLALRLLDDQRLDALLAPAVPFAELPSRFASLVGVASNEAHAAEVAPGIVVSY